MDPTVFPKGGAIGFTHKVQSGYAGCDRSSAESLTRAAAKPRLPGPPQDRALSYPHAKRGFPIPSSHPHHQTVGQTPPPPWHLSTTGNAEVPSPSETVREKGQKRGEKNFGLPRSNSQTGDCGRRRVGESEPPGRPCRRSLGCLFNQACPHNLFWSCAPYSTLFRLLLLWFQLYKDRLFSSPCSLHYRSPLSHLIPVWVPSPYP